MSGFGDEAEILGSTRAVPVLTQCGLPHGRQRLKETVADAQQTEQTGAVPARRSRIAS